MTIAILEYNDGQKARSFKVRPGQCLLIGASNSSDIQLANPDHVSPQHCEVTFASGTLAIKNLTRGQRAVHVNGVQVNRQRLNDGDVVDVGDNRLKVVLREETAERSSERDGDSSQTAHDSTAQAVAAAVAAGLHANDGQPQDATSARPPQLDPTETDSKKSAATETAANEPNPAPADTANSPLAKDPSASAPAASQSINRLPADRVQEIQDEPEATLKIEQNGLRVARVDKFAELLMPIIRASESPWSLAVLANHQASGISGEPPEAVDLLSEQTEEVPPKNDLLFLQADEASEILKLFDRYTEAEAGILILAKPGQSLASNDLKFLAPWLVLPQRAQFNLFNGTDLLLERVFSLCDLIVLRDHEKSCDYCMMADGNVTDWNSFVRWMTGSSHDAHS